MNGIKLIAAGSLTLALALAAHCAAAYDYEMNFDAGEPGTWPIIAIIIDDIGNQYKEGKRAVSLPGPVAYAVLPHTPYGPTLARDANSLGKEVMLHQPLQATRNNHLLGHGAITLDHSAEELHETLRGNLGTVPFVVGVNNHMGSLLTRHPGHMRWLMEALKQDGSLFFVDSVTTGRSIAFGVAEEHGIPSIRRDVFLDSDQDSQAIAVQFERLKQHARRNRFAVGIGHPFPETLQVLEKELPRLSALGYRLVSIQRMIELQSAGSNTTTIKAPRSFHHDPYGLREPTPLPDKEESP